MVHRTVLRTIRAGALPAFALLALSACVSVPESRFYTLDMQSSGSAGEPGLVEVGRFHASDALSKPEILIQATPTRIEYYALDQWAADLAELVQEKLQNEFGAPSAPIYRIEGDILGFEQVDTEDGAQAHVKLRVRAYDANGRRSGDTLHRATYEARLASSEGRPGAIVEALSRALEQIAGELADDLGGLPRPIAES